MFEEALLKELSEVRRMRHDMRNYMLITEGMLEHVVLAFQHLSEDIPGLNSHQDYMIAMKVLAQIRMDLQKRIERLVPKVDYKFTYFEALNPLLWEKKEQAKKAGIDVEYQIHLPAELCMSISDLGVLIGTLMDNAIEAASRNNENPRNPIIHFQMQYHHGVIVIRSSNPATPDSIYFKSWKSTADERVPRHGYGQKTIHNILKYYDGEIIYEYEQGRMHVKLVIPDKKRIE